MKKNRQVSIYISTSSQLCYLTKEFFRTAGLDFYEYDVEKHPEQLKIMQQKSGQSMTPVTEIDGRIIVGYQPEVFNTILNAGDKTESAQQNG